MRLSAFLARDGSYHAGGWRRPGAADDGGISAARWVEFAQTLERAKFDMLFVADSVSPSGMDHLDVTSHSSHEIGFEPITLLSMLSAVTSRLGLAATIPTTWFEPYPVARALASLDHLSGGRAGWNLVTGRNVEDAKNFGREEHPSYDDRYSRADEFIDVVKGLWDSYDDDAIIRDRATGRFFHPEKVHLLNHKGKHFSIKGPLSVSRPPQGHPVIIQAGDSDTSRDLAARTADAMFTAQADLTKAKTFYADVKGRLEKFGREPADLKILPGLSVYVGRTAAEADEKFAELQALIPPQYAIHNLSLLLGNADLSKYRPDEPMPRIEGTRGRADPSKWLAFAYQENLTLLQTAARVMTARAHCIMKGTPTAIADQMEQWFLNEGCDGFNLLPPSVPGDLIAFTELVVPELQRRGLFRTEYEGTTLRENLGLKRPPDRARRAR